MKITLFGYDATKLFDTKENINGVHNCMSGAKYIVDTENKSLTYIGGLSPMFVHGDFPVGDGITPRPEAIEELQNVTAFEVTYSDQLSPLQERKALKFDFANPNKEGLEAFAAHSMRITPNSWECSGKEAIIALIQLAYNACKRQKS